jgi:hypothetical protein
MTTYRLENGHVLADDGSYVTWNVARNPDNYPELFASHPDLLDILAASDAGFIRAIIAKRTDISPETLSKLQQDKSVNVRTVIAARRDTPTEVFRKLAKVQGALIATAIVNNPATPLEVLEMMVKSRSGQARIDLAHRPDCTADMLDILVHDKNSERVATAVVFHPNASANALAVHAEHRFYSIRVAIASHLNTSGETLDLLSRDADIRVRNAVEANPHFVPATSATNPWPA